MCIRTFLFPIYIFITMMKRRTAVKRIIVAVAVLGLVLCTTTPSSAHVPSDKNFAAVQVPIGVDGVMNLNVDGNLAEWDNVPSVFWVTHDDLTEMITGTQGDPDAGNLAERIIVGWSPETNFLYIMEERFDDLWYGTENDCNDKLELVIDADHSGGPFYGGELEERDYGAPAQDWQQTLNTPDSPLWLWGGGVWASAEPYTGIAWSVDGESGGAATLTQESWFTTFDYLPGDSTGPDSPDVDVHTLAAGEAIGLGIVIQDDDNGPGDSYNGYWVHTGDVNVYFNADSLVDHVLLAYDADNWVADATAVEDDSWARIKAGFSD